MSRISRISPSEREFVSPRDIGTTAGKVWQFLHEKGKSQLNAVERNVKVPKHLLHMAIGWLAREGKLEFRQEGSAVVLTLTDK